MIKFKYLTECKDKKCSCGDFGVRLEILNHNHRINIYLDCRPYGGSIYFSSNPGNKWNAQHYAARTVRGEPTEEEINAWYESFQEQIALRKLLGAAPKTEKKSSRL